MHGTNAVYGATACPVPAACPAPAAVPAAPGTLCSLPACMTLPSTDVERMVPAAAVPAYAVPDPAPHGPATGLERYQPTHALRFPWY
eukprot:2639796-Rhodomonas_salina.1